MSSPACPPVARAGPAYAELHCVSSFSFQRGASQPEELVERAHQLGYSALAITDECSVAGVVRAHEAAQRLGLKLLLGSELLLDGPSGAGASAPACRVLLLVHDLTGWGDLCECITAARRAAPKGQYQLGWETLWQSPLRACEVVLLLPGEMALESATARALELRQAYGSRLWLGLGLGLGAEDRLLLHRLEQISRLSGVPLVATGNVHMHVRSRKPLHDVLTAVRLGQPVQACGFALQANAEWHLRSRERLAALYPPALLAATLEIAGRCSFDLQQLRYQYPREAVLPGQTPAQTLRQYTEAGALQRYPQGLPVTVRAQLEHELALIAELHYEMYFLTVHDLVRFARS